MTINLGHATRLPVGNRLHDGPESAICEELDTKALAICEISWPRTRSKGWRLQAHYCYLN